MGGTSESGAPSLRHPVGRLRASSVAMTVALLLGSSLCSNLVVWPSKLLCLLLVRW